MPTDNQNIASSGKFLTCKIRKKKENPTDRLLIATPGRVTANKQLIKASLTSIVTINGYIHKARECEILIIR